MQNTKGWTTSLTSTRAGIDGTQLLDWEAGLVAGQTLEMGNRLVKLAIASPSASTYSETFIHQQMDELPCCLRIHGRPLATETIPGGPIAPYGSFLRMAEAAYLRGWKRQGAASPYAAELKRRLRKHGVQTLLANYGPCGVALLPVCQSLSIPLVVHFHGYDAHQNDVVSRHRVAYRALGQEASAIIVVSRKMLAALTELGVPESKIKLVRYGVKPDRFPARLDFPTDPIFFGIGRFVDKKAPYLTLLAFKKMHEKMPHAKLVLAGDGMLVETMRNLTRAFGLEQAVEFPGVLSPDKVSQWMRVATAFVQHSIVPAHGDSAGDSEGTPVAMLEAMMTGLPIVGTRHAGMGEVVENGRTGILVEERDVDGMAAAMFQLSESPALAKEMGDAARAEALRSYSSTNYIASLRDAIGMGK